MALFDVFKNEPGVVVAHFNHKLRPSADADEEFVRKCCKNYNTRFEVGYLKIRAGEKVSEEKAREERYKFLFSVRDKLKQEFPNEEVKILTAHHLDDLTETVAINLIRGTSWRGLAPFSAEVFRPFLQSDDILLPESKADILTYATRNNVAFRLDPTNYEPDFLRNRVRGKLSILDPQEKYELNQKIKKLWRRQNEIRAEVAEILEEILPKDGVYERKWFSNLDEFTAMEILKVACEKAGIFLTRPQLKDFLVAIKTYAPEKKFNLPEDRLVILHKNYFKLTPLS